MSRIILNYGASSFSGWGVEALNALLYWPGEPLTAAPDVGATLRQGDPRATLLEQRLLKCEAFRASLQSRFPQGGTAADPLFMPLGQTLKPSLAVNNIPLRGTPTIAFPYIEDPNETIRYCSRLSSYDKIVVASDWNAEVVESWDFDPILIHQAVDEVIFNPLARRPKQSSTFNVFSGGKAEYRKGQDIVLQAFVTLAKKHSDVRLMAAWSSPWPNLSRTFRQTNIGEPPGSSIGQPNFTAWAQSLGITKSQFTSIPALPNCQMIDILAEADVAVFPNRFEGGTNQVAMECIACGIPTILYHRNGQKTLADNCPNVTNVVDFDSLCSALETAYIYGLPKPTLGECFTWPYRINALKELLS